MNTIRKYLPIINIVCIISIFGASCVGVINLVNNGNNTLDNINGDTVWSIGLSSEILSKMEYIKVEDKAVGPIAYPVPMLLALQVVKLLPASIFSVVFELAYLLLPLLCIRLLQLVAGLKNNPYRWIIAFFAFFAVWDYIQFDIRALNLNTILLFLVLVSLNLLKNNREISAGIVLGASVVVKLYSVLLLPLWLYKKRYTAVLSATLFLILMFILIPGVALGFKEAYFLTLDWLRAVKSTSTAQASQLMTCYLVSLNRAVTSAFGAEQAAGINSLHANSWMMLNYALGVFKVVWFGFVVFAVCCVQKRQRQADIRQIAILLIAPIPISPLLQPHHLVLILPAVFIVCSIVLMPKISLLGRILAALPPALIFIFSQIIQIPEPVRGFLFGGIAVLLTLSLIYLPPYSNILSNNAAAEDVLV